MVTASAPAMVIATTTTPTPPEPQPRHDAVVVPLLRATTPRPPLERVQGALAEPRAHLGISRANGATLARRPRRTLSLAFTPSAPPCRDVLRAKPWDVNEQS